MYLIVGLGNPDKKYQKNIHNVGFMAIDIIAQKLGVEFNKKAFKGLVAELNYKNQNVILLKPQTYMNLSGDSVKEALSFYKIPTENLIVLYDDLDIPKGSLRIRKSGSPGTHNGMRDIVLKISSQNFIRIRVGTKPENGYKDIIDFVLSDIKKEDQEVYNETLNRSADAVVEILNGVTVENVMNKFNG